ncbi:hypothetical protein SAMN04488128_101207 [Chitinophaga eiseniae]|uniref:DUF4397 domain-containing protein n=1 Tax=Chitinophaga eiseniae TaxID=634771 RepID=A0A1T4KM27_9BACT|nr:hypothetical protein [Chitinophaga eiseniae]SJZ43492.1 hypothetical protein SAMN04488128_101207 [Chitinophaga eiseniae]
MKVCKTSCLLLGVVAFLLAACSKNNDNLLYRKQALSIAIGGYNATNEVLTVKVDTFTLPYKLGAGSFKQGSAFTFGEHQHTVKVSISEESTGKLVLEKEFTREDSAGVFSFLYMDGKASSMPEKPAVEKGKLSLIYMFIPSVTQYSEPVDFVIGKYFVVPKVFEEVARIKNVKPNEFSPAATFPTFLTGRQEYNGVLTAVSFQVRIYKTGTNTPYVDGTEYTWNDISTSAPKPASSVAASKLYIFSEAPGGNLMRFFTRLDY